MLDSSSEPRAEAGCALNQGACSGNMPRRGCADVLLAAARCILPMRRSIIDSHVGVAQCSWRAPWTQAQASEQLTSACTLRWLPVHTGCRSLQTSRSISNGAGGDGEAVAASLFKWSLALITLPLAAGVLFDQMLIPSLIRGLVQGSPARSLANVQVGSGRGERRRCTCTHDVVCQPPATNAHTAQRLQ
jgi:hypothetical protein